MVLFGIAAALIVVLGLALLFAVGVRQRRMDRWLVPYVLQTLRRRSPRRGEPVHLILCVADHYEPNWNASGPAEADARVGRWVREYPALFGDLRDSDGRPPQHTFFYPMEE